MPSAVREYLTFMSVARGCSEKTVREYERDLRTFFRFLCALRERTASQFGGLERAKDIMTDDKGENNDKENDKEKDKDRDKDRGTGEADFRPIPEKGGRDRDSSSRTEGGLARTGVWPDGIDDALLRSVTLADLNRYVAWLRTEKEVFTGRADKVSKGLAPATTRRRAACLRSFFHYLTQNAGILERDPSAGLVVPRKNAALPFFFTEEECRALLDAVDGRNRQRDYAIVLLALVSGMRVSEIVSLNVHDIRTSDGLFFFRVMGKGGKERQVFLSPNCVEALDQYLAVRETVYRPDLADSRQTRNAGADGLRPGSGNKTSDSRRLTNGQPLSPPAIPATSAADRDALFLSRKHRRISVDAVQSLVKRAARRAGLTPVSPHKLRHTAASLMLGHGVDIRTISEVLGHRSISSTQIYTHLQSAQLIEACRANPVSRMERPDSVPETQDITETPNILEASDISGALEALRPPENPEKKK